MQVISYKSYVTSFPSAL